MTVLAWGIAAGIFLIIELLIPMLISIWFGIAAFITMFLAFIFTNVQIQLIFFIFFSIVLIFTTKKWGRINKNDSSSNIGETVTITKILKHNTYEIKYKGGIWTAVSDDIFEAGELAKIKGYIGNKIIIERMM